MEEEEANARKLEIMNKISALMDSFGGTSGEGPNIVKKNSKMKMNKPSKPKKVKLTNEQAHKKPEEVNQPTKEKPEEVNQFTKENPNEVNQPTKKKPQEVNQPTKEKPQEVNQPTKENPVEVNQPTDEKPEEVNQPTKKNPVEVNQPTDEKPEEVNQPTKENPEEVNQPTDEKPEEVNQPTDEKPKKVNQAAEPTKEKPKKVNRPTDEKPKKVNRPTDEKPKKVNRPTDEKPKKVNQATEPTDEKPKKVNRPTKEKQLKVIQRACVVRQNARHVNFAPYNVSTPMYPICRDWLKNSPMKNRNTLADGNTKPKVDMDNKEEGAKGDYSFLRRQPTPLPVDERGDAVRVQIPQPLRSLNEVFFINSVYDSPILPSGAELFGANKLRWTYVRTSWQDAALLNKQRYETNFQIIRQMRERSVQQAMEESEAFPSASEVEMALHEAIIENRVFE